MGSCLGLNRSERKEEMKTNEDVNESRVKTKTNEEMNEMFERKASFERFGDDLSELILSFLSIEDKFRFECLSTQWRRLVFNKQYVLKISRNENLFNSLLMRPKGYYKDFEICLKKLKNLNELHMENELMAYNSQLLRLITNNCHNLKRLSIDSIPGENMENFIQISDQNTNQMFRRLLSSNEGLVSLKIHESRELSLNLYLPKLKEIDFAFCNINELIEVLKNFGHQLEKISAQIDIYDELNVGPTLNNKENAIKLIDGLSLITNLKVLHLVMNLNTDNTEDVKQIIQRFSKIGDNCPKLRRISIEIMSLVFINQNYLSLFKTCKQLIGLEINITEEDFDSENEFNGSFADLKQLTELKRLSVNFDNLSDEDFENMGQYLPHLESLVITTTKTLTDKTLKYISRLKRLKSLEIDCIKDDNTKPFTDFGIKQLLESCLHLRRLVLNPKFREPSHINVQSIECLIQRAEQMPKIQFYLEFVTNDSEVHSYASTDVPDNLIINVNRAFY